jgi:hypothetical protein
MGAAAEAIAAVLNHQTAIFRVPASTSDMEEANKARNNASLPVEGISYFKADILDIGWTTACRKWFRWDTPQGAAPCLRWAIS